jgi:hypothetical protein
MGASRVHSVADAEPGVAWLKTTFSVHSSASRDAFLPTPVVQHKRGATFDNAGTLRRISQSLAGAENTAESSGMWQLGVGRGLTLA